MTERGWLMSGDPDAMHRFLERGHPLWSARKQRLLGCGCVRRMLAHLTPANLEHLDAIERYADGAATEVTLNPVHEACHWHRIGESTPQAFARQAIYTLSMKWLPATFGVFDHVARGLAFARERLRDTPAFDAKFNAVRMVELAENAKLVRDIFGDPFRPVAADPSWLTSDVLALARGIYAERAFDRMPILADALQDAGCTNEDVLNHCRNAKQVHTRGCWVVDLILGKS